LIYNI